jgi:hypothetical protein
MAISTAGVELVVDEEGGVMDFQVERTMDE